MHTQLFPDLLERHLVAELMDDPELDAEEHRQALEGLRRINKVSMTTRMLWHSIRKLSRRLERPLTVLDVACGGGDVLVELGQRARRNHVSLKLTGLDISSTAVQQTQANATQAGVDLETLQFDILGDARLPHHDVVFCSLFLHHLEIPDAVSVLRKMSAAAEHELLVSDLVRSRTGHLLAWLGTRLLSSSKIVHTDGPLSVEAAFTPEELREISQSAELGSARIQKFFPERMLLRWTPSTSANS